MCVLMCVGGALFVAAEERRQKEERRQRESNSPAFRICVSPPITHRAGEWETGGSATLVPLFPHLLGHLFGPPPSQRPQLSRFMSWHRLPRAGREPARCAPPVCQGRPHTSRTLLSSSWAPRGTSFLRARPLSPLLCRGFRTKALYDVQEKGELRPPRALHSLDYEMRGHQS